MAGIIVSGGVYSGSGDVTADWLFMHYHASGTQKVWLPDGTLTLVSETGNNALKNDWCGSSDNWQHQNGTVKVTYGAGTTVNVAGAAPVVTGRDGQLYNLIINQNANPRATDPVYINTVAVGGNYTVIENSLTIISGTARIGDTDVTNYTKLGHIFIGASGTFSAGNVAAVNNSGYNNWDSSGSIYAKTVIFDGANSVFVGNGGTITFTGPYSGNDSDHYVWENPTLGTYYHNSGTIQLGGGTVYGPGETSEYDSYMNWKNIDRPADGTGQASNGDGGWFYNVSGGFRDQGAGARHLGVQVVGSTTVKVSNDLGLLSGAAMDTSTYHTAVSGTVLLNKDSWWGNYGTQGGTNTWGRLYMEEDSYFKAPTGTLTLNKVVDGYTMYNSAGTFVHNDGTVAINFTGTDATVVRNQSHFYDYEQTLPAPTNRVNWRGEGDAPYTFTIANNATIKEGSFRPGNPAYRMAISGTLEVQSGGNYGYSGGDFEAGAVINKVDIKSGGNMYASTGTTVITEQFGNHGTFHNKSGTVFFSGSNVSSYFIDQDGGTHVDPVFYNLTYSGSNTYLMEDITVQNTFLNPSGYIRLTSDKTLTLGTATSKGYLDLKANRMYPYGDSHIYGASELYPAGLSGTNANPILWAYGEGGANHARLKWVDVTFPIDTAGDDDVTITVEGYSKFHTTTVAADDTFIIASGQKAVFGDALNITGSIVTSGSLMDFDSGYLNYDGEGWLGNETTDIMFTGVGASNDFAGQSYKHIVFNGTATGSLNWTTSFPDTPIIVADGTFKPDHNVTAGNISIVNGATWDNDVDVLTLSSGKSFNNRGGFFASSSAFYGDDDHYIQSDAAVAISSNKATYEGWFNATDNGYLFTHYGGSYGFYCRFDGGNLNFYFKGPDAGVFTDVAGLMDSKWHHIAVVVDNTDYKLYIDGELLQHKTAGAYGNPNAVFRIGGVTNYWEGAIANARIFQDARTGAEIRTNMFEETPVGDNLVLNYVFNEGYGTVINDSANSNDGKIYGVTSGVAEASWVSAGTWAAGGSLGSATDVLNGNLYIGKHANNPTMFASSYFDLANRKLIEGSKFVSKSHMGELDYYIATSGTNDYLNYQHLVGAPIGVHNDVYIMANGALRSYFEFDSDANNEQCNTLVNSGVVRVATNSDFYTQDFDNSQGEWLRSTAYDGVIHDDGSTPHEYEPIDIMDDLDSFFDREDLID